MITKMEIVNFSDIPISFSGVGLGDDRSGRKLRSQGITWKQSRLWMDEQISPSIFLLRSIFKCAKKRRIIRCICWMCRFS